MTSNTLSFWKIKTIFSWQGHWVLIFFKNLKEEMKKSKNVDEYSAKKNKKEEKWYILNSFSLKC